jgi:hypothetical protein
VEVEDPSCDQDVRPQARQAEQIKSSESHRISIDETRSNPQPSQHWSSWDVCMY